MKKYKFKVRSRKIQVIADKIIFLRVLKRIHGRYWGIFGLAMLTTALGICYAIERETIDWSIAISTFGTDTRTIPYFTAGLFAGAYGLWRWRNYLNRTTTNPGVITLLITLTILGLYMVAFMPLGWTHTVETLHYLGFAIAGVSMALTVLADIVLRKTKKSKHQRKWQFIRLFSMLMIITGLVVTYLSSTRMNFVLNSALAGELAILLGYGVWIVTKTYQGEGRKTGVSKLLNKIVIID